LAEIADKQKDLFEPYFVRPGGILPLKTNVLEAALSNLFPSIRVDELCAVLLDICIHGSAESTVENADLVRRGKVLLSA